MLATTRDLLAAFFLEKQLGKLRERAMDLVLAGKPLDDDFWPREEAALVAAEKNEFFTASARKLFKPEAPATMADAEDFDSRCQKLMERAAFMTHNQLRRLPFIGQPNFGEP